MALRAIEMQVDAILMAKNIDGVYTADPRKDPSATLIRDITYQDALDAAQAQADAEAAEEEAAAQATAQPEADSAQDDAAATDAPAVQADATQAPAAN